MKILVETVPHAQQRYPTVGDWREYPNGEWHIIVSELGDWRMELLVAVHEIIEQALCKDRGIAEEAVSRFDIAFETNRDPGDETEPGDHPEAPYRREHQFATVMERRLAYELGVDWKDYEDRINAL